MDSTRVSAQLFGRKCRLPVAAWVLRHEKERFYQSEPPPKLGGASQSNLRDELERLAGLGMLEIERPDDSTRVYYVRTASPLWQIVQAAVDVLDGV